MRQTVHGHNLHQAFGIRERRARTSAAVSVLVWFGFSSFLVCVNRKRKLVSVMVHARAHKLNIYICICCICVSVDPNHKSHTHVWYVGNGGIVCVLYARTGPTTIEQSTSNSAAVCLLLRATQHTAKRTRERSTRFTHIYTIEPKNRFDVISFFVGPNTTNTHTHTQNDAGHQMQCGQSCHSRSKQARTQSKIENSYMHADNIL